MRNRENAENNIRDLENMEQQLLSQMQQTMAKKEQVTKILEQKSRALKKNIEPRNAYKLKKADEMSEQDAQWYESSTNNLTLDKV